MDLFIPAAMAADAGHDFQINVRITQPNAEPQEFRQNVEMGGQRARAVAQWDGFELLGPGEMLVRRSPRSATSDAAWGVREMSELLQSELAAEATPDERVSRIPPRGNRASSIAPDPR